MTPPIDITGEFQPSDGAHGFPLYDPQDIKAGNLRVALQLIAGGSVKAGSHATAPAGEIVVQVRTTTGAPTHSATEGTPCWNSVDDALYVNNNGSTGWTAVSGGGSYTDEQAQDAIGAMLDITLVYVDGTPLLTRAALTGDVTAAQGSNATTIATNAVSNAKLADVATQTFKGRTTAATGDPEDLTVAQAKTMLNLTGTNSGDQTITLTGDVAGSGTGSFAATIAADAVTLAKMQNIGTDRLLGRDTAATGDPEELTVGGGVEFTGTGGIQRSALTGDVTAAAGSNTTTVAATHAGSTHSAATDTHIADGTDAHAASAVTNTPSGTVAATTVQAAINELATDYAAADTTHAALTTHHTRLHTVTDTLDHTFPGGSTQFLRADGIFATPPGGGGGGDTLVAWIGL